MKNLNKKDLEKLVKLYEEEREHFTWLITFEEFINDYVVKIRNIKPKCSYTQNPFISKLS